MSELIVFAVEIRMDEEGNHWLRVSPPPPAVDIIYGPLHSLELALTKCATACIHGAQIARNGGI
jgi:hypothetical protein